VPHLIRQPGAIADRLFEAEFLDAGSSDARLQPSVDHESGYLDFAEWLAARRQRGAVADSVHDAIVKPLKRATSARRGSLVIASAGLHRRCTTWGGQAWLLSVTNGCRKMRLTCSYYTNVLVAKVGRPTCAT
jgi:hypothetical protein